MEQSLRPEGGAGAPSAPLWLRHCCGHVLSKPLCLPMHKLIYHCNDLMMALIKMVMRFKAVSYSRAIAVTVEQDVCQTLLAVYLLLPVLLSG